MYSNIAEITSYFRQQYKADLELFEKGPNQGGHGNKEHGFNTHDFEFEYLKDAKILNIPEERRTIFCVFLALEVALDQIFYTYDKDYDEFKEKHVLPKLDFCGHGNVTRNPWSPFAYIKKPLPVVVKIATAVFLKDVINELSEEEQKLFKAAVKNDEDFRVGFGSAVREVVWGMITISIPK